MKTPLHSSHASDTPSNGFGINVRNLLLFTFNHRKVIYKIFLFLATAAIVFLLTPKNDRFNYQYNIGQQWRYEDLYAPFDFAIVKTKAEIEAEKDQIIRGNRPYFVCSDSLRAEVAERFEQEYSNLFSHAGGYLHDFAMRTLNQAYRNGVLSSADFRTFSERNPLVGIIRDNVEYTVLFSELMVETDVSDFLKKRMDRAGLSRFYPEMEELFSLVITPNLSYDAAFTDMVMVGQLRKISPKKGLVSKGQLIVGKDDVISDDTLSLINSLREEYVIKSGGENITRVTYTGHALIILLCFALLFIFLKYHHKGQYFRGKELLFIIFNILMTYLCCRGVIVFSPQYIFLVPICMQTLILRSFFNYKIALASHVVTVLLTSFLAPNISVYIFYGIVTGAATILTSKILYRRAKLFISIAQITGFGIISALGLMLIQYGTINSEMLLIFSYLLIGGMLTLFAQPMTYLYEKVFGLTSDISLLELTDTNSPLLRELAEKAPGTFQHSISVANIAEEVAVTIGANVLLTRVGALHHDIGKINNPEYFTENQGSGFNPHDNLEPKVSASIIVSHVSDGLSEAKRHHLPQMVTNFIRSHHGNSYVYSFYTKAVQMYGKESVDMNDFHYPFARPVSKEEAIVMICDSVEAASRSLASFSDSALGELIERVIDRQIAEKQLDNCEISFREINVLKNILRKRLKNVYHARVAYSK